MLFLMLSILYYLLQSFIRQFFHQNVNPLKEGPVFHSPLHFKHSSENTAMPRIIDRTLLGQFQLLWSRRQTNGLYQKCYGNLTYLTNHLYFASGTEKEEIPNTKKAFISSLSSLDQVMAGHAKNLQFLGRLPTKSSWRATCCVIQCYWDQQPQTVLQLGYIILFCFKWEKDLSHVPIHLILLLIFF